MRESTVRPRLRTLPRVLAFGIGALGIAALGIGAQVLAATQAAGSTEPAGTAATPGAGGAAAGRAASVPAVPAIPASASERTSTELGFAVFQQHCVMCHGNKAYARAPSPAALRAMTPERIYTALTTGIMKSVGDTLSDQDRRRGGEGGVVGVLGGV
jgi:mono/diheme cytochrome c family protein